MPNMRLPKRYKKAIKIKSCSIKYRNSYEKDEKVVNDPRKPTEIPLKYLESIKDVERNKENINDSRKAPIILIKKVCIGKI